MRQYLLWACNRLPGEVAILGASSRGRRTVRLLLQMGSSRTALAALLLGLQLAAALPSWYNCPASCTGACRCASATPPLPLSQARRAAAAAAAASAEVPLSRACWCCWQDPGPECYRSQAFHRCSMPQMPQIVLLTHDDAVNALNEKVRASGSAGRRLQSNSLQGHFLGQTMCQRSRNATAAGCACRGEQHVQPQRLQRARHLLHPGHRQRLRGGRLASLQVGRQPAPALALCRLAGRRLEARSHTSPP